MVDFLSCGSGAYPISAGAVSFGFSEKLSDLTEILAGGANLFVMVLAGLAAISLPIAVIAVFSLLEVPRVTPWWAYALLVLVVAFVVCVEISAFMYLASA